MAVVPVRLDLTMTMLSDDLQPPPRAALAEHRFADLLDRSLAQASPVGVAAAGDASPLEQSYQSAARDEFLAARTSFRSLTESTPNGRAAEPADAQPLSNPSNDPGARAVDSGSRQSGAERSDGGPEARTTDASRAEAPEKRAGRSSETTTKSAKDDAASTDPGRTSNDPQARKASTPAANGEKSAAVAQPNPEAGSSAGGAKSISKVVQRAAGSSSAVERELTGALTPAHLAADGAAPASASAKKPTSTTPAGNTAAAAAQHTLVAKLSQAEPKPSAAQESGPNERSAKRPAGKDAATADRLAAIAASVAGAPLAVSVDAAKPAKSPDAGASGLGAQGGVHGAESATPAKADQQHLTVIDLRGAAHHDPVQASPDASQASQSGGGKFQQVEVRLLQLDGGARGAPQAKSDGVFVPARSDAASQLQQNWGTLMNQLVRGSGIVLRDGGSGEIRLVLKPEHLGSVRVRLEMNDNQLSGRIVVDNQNVRQLFQQNLDALSRAFQESGFGFASLDVSVSGGDRGEREKGRSSPLPQVSGIAADDLERSVPSLIGAGAGDSLINLFV